jgi:AraC-like DNA-binding protein
MIDFSISNVGCYTNQEKRVQIIHVPWIMFQASGLIYSRLHHPNGLLIENRKDDTPFFRIALPGMKSEFEYGTSRENWVIMLPDIPVRYSESSIHHVEIKDENEWISIPHTIHLEKESIGKWQIEFQRIQQLFRNPIPKERLQAKLEVLNIFNFILNKASKSSLGESPAGKLKRLIDHDIAFEKSLSELSNSCSYSRDHLRILFKKEFHISPNEYRNHKRMAQIMEYIANSSLTIKEIAAKTGFEHTSHLCMAFKKCHHITPGQGIKLFRYGYPRG